MSQTSSTPNRKISSKSTGTTACPFLIADCEDEEEDSKANLQTTTTMTNNNSAKRRSGYSRQEKKFRNVDTAFYVTFTSIENRCDGFETRKFFIRRKSIDRSNVVLGRRFFSNKTKTTDLRHHKCFRRNRIN